MIRAAALCLLVLGGPSQLAAQQAAPDDSQRPTARAPLVWAVRPAARPLRQMEDERPGPTYALRPVARPSDRPAPAPGNATSARRRAEADLFAFSPTAPATSPLPRARPAIVLARAAEARAARLRGQVCGDPAIQGVVLGRVEGAGACGIDQAVRVRAVGGVQLTPNATMDCPTAQALKTWVTRGLLPVTTQAGDRAAGLRIVSHYSCRGRNSDPSARLSEHSFGRAIDIAGIRLASGREMTLLTDWNSARDGAVLRALWRTACGPFGTVLGPESNAYHRDHFHFDTARYRSGAYCR